MLLLSLDTETSIKYIKVPTVKTVGKGEDKNEISSYKRKAHYHGGTFRPPDNDIYTFIYGTHPDNIKLLHKKQGFKRKVPYRISKILDKNPIIVGSNLKFDLAYIWQDLSFKSWLLRGGQVWDIQLVRYLLSAQLHSYPSLAEMQKIYLGVQTKKDRISLLFSKLIGANEIIAAKDRCPRVWKLYCEYGVEDGRTPLLIMKKQYLEVIDKGMLPIVKLYNKYLLALTMIETNGLHLDMELVETRHYEFNLKMVESMEKSEEIVRKLWTDYRLPELNINSTQHASAILFGGDIPCEHKVPTGEYYGPKAKKAGQEKLKTVKEKVHVEGFGLDPKFSNKTKTGIYETGEHVIDKIYKSSDNDTAKEYCRYRRLSSAYRQKISTYLNAFLYRSIDGIIYPNYNNTETITSRLSASAPNVQNLPSHGEWGKLIQSLIVAPKGWTCVQIDFSQLETYCRALLTKDPDLARDLVMGMDFHVQNMAWGFGITYEEGINLSKVQEIPEWAERRSNAKAVTFGEAYGQMPESMSARTGWPIEVVEKIYKNMYENYPGLVNFDKVVTNSVEQSSKICRKSELPSKLTRGNVGRKGMYRKFIGDAELLPIRSLDKKSFVFDADELRHIGYYQSITGKLYCFEEFGSMTKSGNIFRYFKPTQIKNYPMQGTAGDIQALTTVAMLSLLLKHSDKVKIINEIHDSKWFIVKNEYLTCIVPKLHAIMCNASGYLNKVFNVEVPFQFKADVKIGPNFSDLETYKLD